MSLDTVDVVHGLEDALGSVAHQLRALADSLEDGVVAIDRGLLVASLRAMARDADEAMGEGSALAEWRLVDDVEESE